MMTLHLSSAFHIPQAFGLTVVCIPKLVVMAEFKRLRQKVFKDFLQDFLVSATAFFPV